MRIKYIICFLFFLSLSLTEAQGGEEYLCRVIDIENKYPISYATIQFENVDNGVIADEEGNFRLPISYNKKGNSIIISSIGYETLKVKVETLDFKIINILYLKSKVEELSAVLIKASSGGPKLSEQTIIKNAIGKIPTNYPNSPHSYVSYYRDYQLVNNTYFNLNEAILESFDAGFNTNKLRFYDNRTAIYSYDLNKDFFQDTLLLNSIYGKSKLLDTNNAAKLGTDIQNELGILNIHNPIRNYNVNTFSFIYVFRDDFVFNHNFKLVKIQYIEDTPLYEIEFISKPNPNSRYMGAGKIYISKGDFAIYKLEYKVFSNNDYVSNRSKDNVFVNMSKDATYRNNATLFEVNLEYKPIGDKMYLNYMTFNNRFIIKEPNPFKVEEFNFNPNDESFYITFNKPVDASTIKRKSNFKLRYNNNKLIIKNIDLVESNMVKVTVIDWSAGISEDPKNVTLTDFTYKIKKIKDLSGAIINKASKLIGYQFREIFTQEVFKDKQPNDDLIFVNKTLPMSKTRVNKVNFDIKKYTINSPLKKTKNN
ncbi:carboxypeptidase-like regulatory domain-containing protein [Winogradskyella sp. UBA3174]|uniref:carboxypeptidase-like regulatory domain-containing protein n=1 Tax=Winogradskyella sp. UBA3174 TaxID=1947785 RepID=UPI0025F10B5F|nr:carboxypeptidase-like regulatory domain-containing protein [Winogradskyella sp. UBA3174]|tara:strand:- start:69833 stop:71443 length:1611 start_codon:yes stop_codon:yes gene_type:complete